MNIYQNFKINCDTFSANRVNNVGVLRFKKNFLLRTTDLTDRDRILDYLDFLEALKLGIVDQIVPADELVETALETADRFGRKPTGSLWGIKRLLNYSYKDLVDYMEFENQM